jgi:hypothetical protein
MMDATVVKASTRTERDGWCDRDDPVACDGNGLNDSNIDDGSRAGLHDARVERGRGREGK